MRGTSQRGFTRRAMLSSFVSGFSLLASGCLHSANNAVLIAYYENEEGEYVKKPVLEKDSFESVGEIDERGDSYHLNAEIKKKDAEKMADRLVSSGFGDGTQCQYEGEFAYDSAQGECLVYVANGDILQAGGVAKNLGEAFQNGDFVEHRENFVISFDSRAKAQQFRNAIETN